MSYDSAVLADSPIRYYKLNETSGTIITDYGSQGINGTLHGGVTLNQSALAVGLGKCALFDGSTGYIDMTATSLPTGAGILAIECWLSTSSIPGSGFQSGVQVGNSGTDAWETLLIHNSGSNISYSYGNDDLFAGSIATNTTYYLLGVWDGIKQQLYIGTGGSVTNYNRIPGGAPNLTYGSALIGKDLFGDFITGSMSNVAIYTTALSSARATAHYNAGITASTTHLRISDGLGGVFS